MNEMKKGRNPLPGVSPTLRDRQQGVFYMLHLKEEVQQATAFDGPVVGHWLEGEKAQNQGQVHVHAWAIPPPDDVDDLSLVKWKALFFVVFFFLNLFIYLFFYFLFFSIFYYFFFLCILNY